jgi:DNA-binding LacI/PurR family transcriptional regulator
VAVTLAEIARQAGVAKSVASTVLNKSHSTVRISEKTRQRVMAIAGGLNYQPSFSARALRKCKTFMLGFICGDIHTPNFSELASIVLGEAEKRGYRLLISITEWNYEKEIDCLKMLLQRQVDGVMMWSAAIRPGGQRHELITREKLPVVIFDQEVAGVTSITVNWQPGMDKAVGHLKSIGHTRLGYIRQSNIDMAWDAKRQTFLETCSRYGVATMEYDCLANLEDARRIGRQIAHDPNRPTAVIALSDYIATGVIRSLFEEGVTVPCDLAVVGMDGTVMGQCFRPALTSITMDRQRMAVEAINLLLEIIEGKDVPPRVISIPTDLVVREST